MRDVSVTIAPGSFFTLLGPSGSGKTTTLMMVAGFAHPTRGEVFVDGKPMAALPPQKRDLGMVFQSYAVFPHLTVFDNVAFPLQVRRTSRLEMLHRVGEALELVRLTGYERRLPRQLSGGEQQRVALARALVFRPRVLLMDEPLGALDKKLRAHMQLELKHIQQHLHVTVIYVTHDQEEALTMSDRVAVMQGGRIEQVGSPAELYDRPASRFVADFLGESNFLDATAVSTEGDGRWRCRAAGGLEFAGVAAAPLQAGQPVTAAVRPEKLVQAEDAGALGPGANACKGLVEEAIYVGDVTRYRVGLGADGAVIDQGGEPGWRATSRHRRDGCARVVTGGHAPLSPRRRMKPTEERRETLRHLLMLLPAVLVLAVLFAYPLLGIVNRSVYKAGYTLDMYRQIFRVPVYLQVILATFKVSALVTMVCLALGYPLAYVLATRRPRTAQLLMIIVVLPFFTSIIVRTYAWMVLLGRNGIVNQYLMALGFTDKPLLLLYNQGGVVIGMSYVLLPYMVLTVYSVMRSIDPRLVRAAHSLGASRLQAFRRVFLPLSLPGIAGGTLLVFILSLGFFITPALMGGPGDMMIAMLIEREVEITLNWSFASALAVILLALTLVGFTGYNRIVRLERVFEGRH